MELEKVSDYRVEKKLGKKVQAELEKLDGVEFEKPAPEKSEMRSAELLVWV